MTIYDACRPVSDIYDKEDTYWWHVGKRLLVQNLIKQYLGAKGSEQVRALDVGCGAGRVLQMLSEHGQAFGTDLSQLALEFCQKRGFREVCQADMIAGLPFPASSFDLITALDVVEHLEDDGAGLRNLWEALKPGGLLIVSVPAYQFMFSYWDDNLGHKRRYTLGSLQRELLAANFKIEKISYSNTSILFPAVTFRLLKGLWLRFKKQPEPEQVIEMEALEAETDFVSVPKFLNNFLIKLYQVESSVIGRWRLPCGLAVLAAARKPLEVSVANDATRNRDVLATTVG